MRRDIEEILRQFAIKSPEEIRSISVEDYFKSFTLEPLSKGSFFRVFKIAGFPWVLKEGRWDIHLSIHNNIHLPILPEFSGLFFRSFSSEIYPTIDEISRQFKDYLQFVEYFGFDQGVDNFYKNHNQIKLNQKSIRDSLIDLLPLIQKNYKIKISKKIISLLDTDLRYYNFLPKEYSLVGPAISAENKGRDTVFIFQEYISGTNLHDLKRKRMSYEQKSQLILLVYLILVMHYQIGLLPDTRPRNPLLEIFEWLPKTDNIILSLNGVKFVDTRWFWETESNFIKRGAVIPELSLNSTKIFLNRLLSSI